MGAIEELPGQYLSLGYNGNGMVNAFSCGRHVAELIAGSDISQPLISEAYSPDRFDNSAVQMLNIGLSIALLLAYFN